MIRLNLSAEPQWLELVPGLRLEVRPVTTAVMASARADVMRAGAADDPVPEASDEEMAVAMAKAAARQVITAWEGVADEAGEPVDPSPDAIDALLDIWPVFEAFQHKVLGPHMLLGAEKNGSAPLPSGTTAGAIPTAKRARRSAKTARQS